ncbi:PIN domain-containing protein [Lipomyces japonicus]|uniref:PIN domain-containing protein n=1 Tax=Lipomyces japonicus TaxID=56871 RepID=UPI0034CD2A83
MGQSFEDDLMDIDSDDWGDIQDAITSSRVHQLSQKNHQQSSNQTQVQVLTPANQYLDPVINAPVLFVVDTNFIISNLKILDDLVRLYRQHGHVMVFPLTVIRELDSLKNLTTKLDTDLQSIHRVDVGFLARKANNWLFKALARSNPGIRGQRSSEVIQPGENADDSILDCCRYFQERLQKSVVLFSNDKNLCVKALIYSLRTVTYVRGLTAIEILVKSIGLGPEHLPRKIGDSVMISSEKFIARDSPDSSTSYEDMDIDGFDGIPSQNNVEIQTMSALPAERLKPIKSLGSKSRFWFPNPTAKVDDSNFWDTMRPGSSRPNKKPVRNQASVTVNDGIEASIYSTRSYTQP